MSEDRALPPVHHPRIPAQRRIDRSATPQPSRPLIDLSVTPPASGRSLVTRGRLAAVAVALFLAGAAGYTALRPVLPSFAPVVPPRPSVAPTTDPGFQRPGVPPSAADPVLTKPAPS